MRKLFRAFILAIVSLGLAAGPAMARDGRYSRHHRGHGGGIDAGHVFLGIIGIAAIAAAADKSRRNRDARVGDYPSYPDVPPASREYPRDDYPRDDDRGDRFPDGDDAGLRVSDRDAAINACAYAAENEGDSRGDRARVRDIQDVTRDGEKFRIRGEVEIERGGDRYGSRYYDKTSFSCVAQDGRVTAFRFDDGASASYRR